MQRERAQAPSRNADGKTRARRDRWQSLLPTSTVSALASAGVAAIVVIANGGQTVAALPAGNSSPVLASEGTGVVDPAVAPYLNPKLIAQVPVGPGAVSSTVKVVLDSPMVVTALAQDGIPQVALEAYQGAAKKLAASDPGCHLPWQLLAAIGRVESDDGRFGGSELLANGNTTRPIYGIPLDGRPGVALVRDTDGGKLDGDPNFDRAVGPMQFIPSTWATYGADGNGDGKRDPNNIFDAALAAGDLLCAGGGNMTVPSQAAMAVLRYNDADQYVRVVLALEASYEHGGTPIVPLGPVTGGGPGTGSVSPATASPAPAKTSPAPATTPAPKATTPAPKATTPSSRPTSASPTTAKPAAKPTPTPTASASATPTATASATPTATASPSATPSASATPTPSGSPSAAPQTADVGWAPAMRQVVLHLLGIS